MDQICESDRVRALKRMAKNIAASLLPHTKIQSDDFVRAGGDVVCDRCGLKYIEHPEIPGLGLHINCVGILLKL